MRRFKSARFAWWRHAVVTAVAGILACRSDQQEGKAPASIVGRYVASYEGESFNLDFRPDGSVLFQETSMRYSWERSHDTVFIHGGPQTRFETLLVRGDSLVGALPGLAFVRAKRSG